MSYLYCKDEPLKWTVQMYSYYFGFKYAVGSLALLIGTPLLRHFEISDHIICIVGILSKMAGFILLGLSTTDIMMFLGKFFIQIIMIMFILI